MNKKIGTLLAVTLIALFFLFQNCSSKFSGFSQNATTAQATRDPDGDDDINQNPTDTPFKKSVAERLAELEVKRRYDWLPKNGNWDVYWDGSDTPADNVAGPYMWDCPVDDDWWNPLIWGDEHFYDQYRLNTPSRGFMTVDRKFMNQRKTGTLFRRDEYLDPDFAHAVYGITYEVRVKLGLNSDKDSFYINYVGKDCTMSVSLSGSSPDARLGMIASGGVVEQRALDGSLNNHTGHRELDTTSDFITLRLVRGPNAPNYEVFLVNYSYPDDGMPYSSRKLLDGVCDPGFKVGSYEAVRFPYIQIGDNSGSPDSNANFIVDFVRYRRDAVLPTTPLPGVLPRTPPPLPQQAPYKDDHLFTAGYFGDTNVTSQFVKSYLGSTVLIGGNWNAFKDSGTPGIIHLETGADGHTDIETDHPYGLTNGGDFTIEMRLKTLPGHGDRGFRLYWLDVVGATSFYISPNRIETMLGFKPAGVLKHMMNTADDFHIYRLVRRAGEMYAYVYVDNDPVPVIVDVHLSAEVESKGWQHNPIIHFGAFKVYPEAYVSPVKTTTANLLIDYIRWHGYAYAPANK